MKCLNSREIERGMQFNAGLVLTILSLLFFGLFSVSVQNDEPSRSYLLLGVMLSIPGLVLVARFWRSRWIGAMTMSNPRYTR